MKLYRQTWSIFQCRIKHSPPQNCRPHVRGNAKFYILLGIVLKQWLKQRLDSSPRKWTLRWDGTKEVRMLISVLNLSLDTTSLLSSTLSMRAVSIRLWGKGLQSNITINKYCLSQKSLHCPCFIVPFNVSEAWNLEMKSIWGNISAQLKIITIKHPIQNKVQYR